MPLILPESRGAVGHPREGSEAVRTGEGIQAAADRDEELGAQYRADAGQGLDHLGEFVLAKPALDGLVRLGVLLVEGRHLLREGEHHLCDGRFTRDGGGVLPLGGLYGLRRQRFGSADLAGTQQPGGPALAGVPDRYWGLVARQEHDRSAGSQVQSPFQDREHTGQQRPEPVDSAGSFSDQADMAIGQQPQFHRDVVGAYRLQVTPHPGLIGDGAGVPGVGLALTAIAVRAPVDSDAGDVDKLLAVVDQQRQLAAGHVQSPGNGAAAVRFADEDYDILLIGHEGYEEVIGTLGEAPDRIQLVDGPAAAARVQVRDPSKVVWLSQTTLSVGETMETVSVLRGRFPALLSPPSDDICYATQNRQQAVRQLSSEADLVIVVGSRNSSNSVRLVEVALQSGARAAHLVNCADEIDEIWLETATTIGVTSGASVPEVLTEQVLAWLTDHGFADIETITSAEEHQQFALPRELRDPSAHHNTGTGSQARMFPEAARKTAEHQPPGPP